ncbi:shikimate kinase [Salicola sp. Rm-C-2C1-2]|uniref:shikimate kinase n=1 Tax=Salicola sp. Rm-C-2C1-2 TaxID=3141321 RepID=UPI0032E3A512
MDERKSNIALIGMPGSGKSTVGVLLAKASGRDFVDTDLLIQSRTGSSLQSIVDERGYEALREVEEQVLLSLAVSNHVIATGGSVVYSEAGMAHLKTSSVVVFLDVSLNTVRNRIGDYSLRGISKRPDQSIQDLFEERLDLYRHYSDIVIACDNRSMERVCEAALAQLEECP